jgi:hypothetical protein
MFIDRNVEEFGFLFFFIVLIILASLMIPFWGYSRKRLKGLTIGCLLQPVICIIVILILLVGTALYESRTIRQTRKAAMVTIRSTESHPQGNFTLMWYLKPDEECFAEFMTDSLAKKGNHPVFERFAGEGHRRHYYDIVRLDSTSLNVEDRIVVKFDTKNQKVTATDYDKPAEVVSVDWEKVKAYLNR